MKLQILRGLQGSGKTTYAKAFCEKNNGWVRINRDDFRNMSGRYDYAKREDLITDWENFCIVAALAKNFNVILDATNLNGDRNSARVEKLERMIKSFYLEPLEFEVEYKDFFDISLEECIRRDSLRTEGKVGEKVIRQFYDKYLKPEPVKYDENYGLPHCVIFDIDGTLAHKGDRSPYDWAKVYKDTVNDPVAYMLRMMRNDPDVKIIIFTGRDGVCEQDTRDWLGENDIHFDALFIRPTGNMEKDSIIKKRMFEENIRGKYYCDFVVDDRQQVVDMWRRELGLTCFQVDYGNF